MPPELREILKAKSAITLAEYMELALQHPAFGYYRRGDPLGRAGDFITAPEISQLFGEMIGVWCAAVWRQLGKPERFTLLELGPGRGTLMQDLLRATAHVHGLHEGMTLCLLESSATLRAVQQEKLAAHQPRFLETLDDIDATQPLIVIANEFFDALPIRQFEKTFQGWQERLVALKNDQLVFTLSPPDPAFALLIPQELRDAPPATVYELSLASVSVMQKLAGLLAAHTGAALIVDYGYLDPPRLGTLQAVAGHRAVDVLERTGEVDLTAHINFGLLKQVAAKTAGLKIFGPSGLGVFFQNMGVDIRAAQLVKRATSEQAAGIESGMRRLTDDAEMGSLFKVMMIASLENENGVGFE